MCISTFKQLKQWKELQRTKKDPDFFKIADQQFKFYLLWFVILTFFSLLQKKCGKNFTRLLVHRKTKTSQRQSLHAMKHLFRIRWQENGIEFSLSDHRVSRFGESLIYGKRLIALQLPENFCGLPNVKMHWKLLDTAVTHFSSKM